MLSWAAGVSPQESDDWTQGELLCAVQGWRERERERCQRQAVIARTHAMLINCVLSGEHFPEVWEAFPYWTEEEIKAARVEEYRRVMERHAAQRVVTTDE